jgi:hypothetical protein
VTLRPTNDRVVVDVCDTGEGPPDTVRDKLFEPFVSGKPDGVGLGLSVAAEIAKAHQGDIRWQRRDGLTCFSVELPKLVANDEAATHEAPAKLMKSGA